VFAASDWAIELKLLMATIDRHLVAETFVVLIMNSLEQTRFIDLRGRKRDHLVAK